MFYPKSFEKQAVDAGTLVEDVIQPGIGYIRKANRINNIIHAADALKVDAPSEEEVEDAAEAHNGVQPLYVKHDGQLYPSVFGYQVPVEMIPRVIKPVLRNLPEGEL